MTKLKLQNLPINGKGDDSQQPYYDKKLRAIIHNDVHLTPQNKKRLVEKEYHTYDVQSLKADLGKIDANIELFREHIKKEEARKDEIRRLIKEGEERDQRLLELLG